jgi:hypothetical protein
LVIHLDDLMLGESRTYGVQRTRRGGTLLAFERLESRLAMAGVAIHEFLAFNASGLADEDGDRSDWIELKNTSTAPIDITGWYLTNDAADLTKWQLPAAVIDAGDNLTIFASGKDRAIAGEELHTNFDLLAAGQYLGLVMADGTTVAHEFAPFPEQFADVSYGTAASSSSVASLELIGQGAPARVISPSAQNAALDDAWRDIGFNASSWIATTTGVGFDRDSSPNNILDPYIGAELTTAQMPSSSARTSAYVRVPFAVADKDQLTSLSLDLRYDDGFIAYLNGREIARRFFQEDDARPQPQWDSRANGNRPDSDVIVPVTFDLTPHLDLLVSGDNVLAFHGVNSTSQNTDFLIDPILRAERATAAMTGYMRAATPGAENGVGTLGFVSDTKFSIDRGFYDAPTQVAITTDTPAAAIRYTIDGSPPSETAGTLYAGPITIGTTTMLRAIAYKSGFISSNVDTQTYIFTADIVQQTASDLPEFVQNAVWGHDKDDADTAHDDPDWEMDPDIVNNPAYSATIHNDLKSIPTVSITMDWADLIGDALVPGSTTRRGIYLQGKGDERATSFEYFTADGASQFQIDAAIEMQGHSSTTRWNSDKMSFQLKFKPPFGPANFNASLFPGTADGENAATRFDTLILDAGYNYTWIHQNPVQHTVARYVTDQVVSDLQNLAGGRAPHGKYVHLYLNGMYWGLYNLHERPDESFADVYFGGIPNDYDVIKHNPAPDIAWAAGGVTALNNYNAMLAATEVSYAAAEALIDVDDFIKYMIVHYYAANNDWSHNNWYASRNRVVAGSKWRFHAWDQEHAFPTSDNTDSFTVSYDSTTKDDPSAPTAIHNNLMAFGEYKLKFSDQVQKLLHNGGLLTPIAAAAVYQARTTEIDRAIVGESARWGDNRAFTDPFTRDDWVAITNGVLANFFPQRTEVLLNQFATRGWLQSLAAPEFDHYGGEVTSGFDVTIEKPAGSPGAAEIYYTIDGTDPRLASGAANPAAMHSAGPVSIDVSTAMRVKARIKNGSDWSALIDAIYTLPELHPIRITELHYHPANHPGVTDPEDLEFIELMNTGSDPVSLAGVQIAQFAASPYTFGSGINLAAGQRIIVARNRVVFQSVYGTSINLAPTGFGGANLSNGGERITLSGPFGETLQDFTYHDTAPWPTSPDGGGRSLEIIDPLGDPTEPTNWRASAAPGGSPGTLSPPAIPGDYDGNAAVEPNDYDHWKSTFDSTTTVGTGADGNGSGIIDAADYVIWRKNFSVSPASGSSLVSQDESPDQIRSARAAGANVVSTSDGAFSTATTRQSPSFAPMLVTPNAISTKRGRRSPNHHAESAEAADQNELLALSHNARTVDFAMDELAATSEATRRFRRWSVALSDLDCATVDSALDEFVSPDAM